MPTTIASIFHQLDTNAGKLPLPVILEWLKSHPLTVEDVAPYIVFHREHYVRNLLHNGPDYQALVLCWENGQRSPIHNHRGSHCGVKVLRGTATETFFERGPNGLVLPVRSRQLPAGHICASSEEDTHQISNLQAGGVDLVTLHIYSPPLLKMDVYSLDSPAVREFLDPINVPCVDGGGI